LADTDWQNWLAFAPSVTYTQLVPPHFVERIKGDKMKSTLDKLDGLSRKLNIEIPAEKVQEAFEKVYKGIQKNATVKGFRKGKAPIATIRTIYSDRVKSDVVQDLIQDNYQAALEEHSLDPVGFPKISFTTADEASPFHFTAEFEIRPEVVIKKFENLPVQKEILEISDERVAGILENIRTSQAETITVFEDRALAQGDVAVLDFVGEVGGQPLPNGSAEGHMLEIGSGQFIEGFEEGVTGMKIGERRDLNLRFPEAYHEPTIAGQPVTFHVTLKGIKKKVLPELNDELAKKVGTYENLEGLKEAIRKDIRESEERRILEEMRNRLIKVLVESNPIQVPRTLVAEQKKALVEDFKGRMQQQGLGEAEFEQYKDKWEEDFEKTATFMVHSTFLLDTLAHQLKLEATAAEIDEKVDEYAKQTGIALDKIKQFYAKPERRSRLAFQITEQKVVDHLLGKAKVQEVAGTQLKNVE
jgi:trigger factor